MRDGLILVQGAMDVETEWLTAQLEAPEETELGEFPFWRGTCRGRELVVSRTGVGMVRAAAATALGIQRFAPALVVNQGIAGAHREATGQEGTPRPATAAGAIAMESAETINPNMSARLLKERMGA